MAGQLGERSKPTQLLSETRDARNKPFLTYQKISLGSLGVGVAGVLFSHFVLHASVLEDVFSFAGGAGVTGLTAIGIRKHTIESARLTANEEARRRDGTWQAREGRRLRDRTKAEEARLANQRKALEAQQREMTEQAGRLAAIQRAVAKALRFHRW